MVWVINIMATSPSIGLRNLAPRISQLHLILRIHVVGHRCPNLVESVSHVDHQEALNVRNKKNKSRWSKISTHYESHVSCEWFLSFNGVSNPHFVPLQQWPNRTFHNRGWANVTWRHPLDWYGCPAVCMRGMCILSSLIPIVKKQKQNRWF